MMDGCAWHVGTPGGWGRVERAGGSAQALAAWVMAKRVWQAGAEITMGSAPLWPCLPLFLMAHSFLENAHINTHTPARTHTHIYAPAQRHSAGLSPDLLNLASDSGTCY